MVVIRVIVGTIGGLVRWLGAAMLSLLMPWRWFRRRSIAASAPAAVVPAPEPETEAWPEMPRIGRPGTATDEQVEALMALRVVPAPPCRDLHDYSREEAAAILDAIAFAREVAAQVTGGEDEEAPPEALTALLNELVALRWARSGKPTPIRENTTFEKARAVVLRYWQPQETAAG
jgi:hypothetical protein